MSPAIYKIKDLPQNQRPREQLIEYGPSSLSESELLAIILNTGIRKNKTTEDVLTLAQRILKQYGDKAIIFEENVQKLAEALDIPAVKACQIVACFELGRRYFHSEKTQKTFFHSPKDVYNYLSPKMSMLKKEQLRGLYLNSRNQLVHEEIISIGTLTQSLTDPREVFEPAISHSALAIILAHNHPSGSPEPSNEDIILTEQMIKAGKIINIHVIDHVIITHNNYLSLRQTQQVSTW